jgi:hypothetical protein
MEQDKMVQGKNKVENQDDIKKLSFVVVCLSLFVITIFGVIPLV